MTVVELADKLQVLLSQGKGDWVVEVMNRELHRDGYVDVTTREADGIEAVGCYVVID